MPIPTLPPAVANHAPPLVVKAVDDAYGKLKRIAESFQEKLELFCESRPHVPANNTEFAVMPETVKLVVEAVLK